MLAGQLIVGACVSLTVTVKEHACWPLVVQFTVVMPTGKDDPDAGVQTTLPQSPPVVGDG